MSFSYTNLFEGIIWNEKVILNHVFSLSIVDSIEEYILLFFISTKKIDIIFYCCLVSNKFSPLEVIIEN